jgi:large subunit ribosomal protein L6
MSRIGKLPIPISQGVKVSLTSEAIAVEGPKGRLRHEIHPLVKIQSDDKCVTITRNDATRESSAVQGLMRSLIFNMVKGVVTPYVRELEIVGVGYKAELQGRKLVLSLGLSHQVPFEIPAGIDIKVEEKNTKLIVSGCDKALVGLVVAKLRSYRPPEPYKGKGVKYKEEVIKKKVGKAGASA